MKRSCLLLSCLGLFSPFVPPVQAQTFYNEAQISTYVREFSGWNMQTTRNYTLDLRSATLPFVAANIVGISVHIFNDTRSELYPLTRQAELAMHDMTGGNFQLQAIPPVNGGREGILIHMDRGVYQTGQLYSLFANSGFASATAIRGRVIVEYAATTPAAAQSRTLWLKMGPKNADDITYDEIFSGKRGTAHLSLLGLTSDRFVGISAVMHSDLNTDGSVNVNNLARLTSLADPGDPGPGRGGKIYLKDGAVRWGTGPYYNSFSRFSCKSVFRTCPAGNPYTHTQLNSNRGWARIDYTGSEVAYPVPYAVKTKARTMGAWSMGYHQMTHNLPWDFGIHSSRVMSLTTTIRSDAYVGSYYYTNFHRIQQLMDHGYYNPGNGDPNRGGVAFLDGIRNNLRFTLIGSGFYAELPHSATTGNRGYVKVDYQAGSCEEGTNGFSIKAIPGVFVGKCEGTSQPFALEGAGQDIFNSSDDFAYVYKSGSGDRDLVIKVESHGNTSGWAKTGLMFRANLNANSAHASMLITPSNGAHLTYRPSHGSQTTRTSSNTIKAPYYLRIRKVGNTFTAYYRSPSTTTWTQVGSPQTLPVFGTSTTTYYYGLAQSSNSPSMNKATFSGRNF